MNLSSKGKYNLSKIVKSFPNVLLLNPKKGSELINLPFETKILLDLAAKCASY